MLWVLGLGCSEPVVVERPWSADPILLTISVHGHNYGLDTSNEDAASYREERYTSHQAELLWLADLAESEGMLLSVQLNGEYARDAIAFDDTAHLDALQDDGHELSVHFHRFHLEPESAFLVAAGERLTVGDLLTLAQAPQTVVLSTCDGAASPAVAAESLGLAQAFLLAGAEQVIAAVEPVQDSDSRALMERLYASPADPVGAWRDAVLASDAVPYRLMVP